MARRKTQRKARTLPPAPMKLYFGVNVAEGGSSTSYISIAHALSRLNRRFYRQGYNYAVANVKITQYPSLPAASGSTCYVNTLPHTWSTANSWMKSFSLWKRQQDEAMALTSSQETVARFRDFKISMEDSHTVGTDLTPVTMGPGRNIGPFLPGPLTGGSVLPSEEWVGTQIVVPNDGGPGVNTEYLLHMVGPDIGTSKGMIQGYADSRGVPQSPDPSAATPAVETSWMQEMFDVGGDSSLITDNAEFRNNELPYDQVDYPGGALNNVQLETQGFNWNQSTVGINTWSTGPFTAPCGLIRVDFMSQAQIVGDNNSNIIEVTLVPGRYKGYLAETMEEF